MEESAATAALVGMALALVEVVKKFTGKVDPPDRNRNLEFRVEMVENQIKSLTEKIDELQKSFYDFREESRIRWAKSGEDD